MVQHKVAPLRRCGANSGADAQSRRPPTGVDFKTTRQPLRRWRAGGKTSTVRPWSDTCGHVGDHGVCTRPIVNESLSVVAVAGGLGGRHTPTRPPTAAARTRRIGQAPRGATTDYGGNCMTETTECTRGHAGDHGGHHATESEIPRCGPPVSPARRSRTRLADRREERQNSRSAL